VRLLLDTHIFLWATSKPERLPPGVRRPIEDLKNEIFVSSVVSWEIALEHARGKLSLPMSPGAYVPSRIKMLGFTELPITIAHTLAVSDLPPHHLDPFDRLLIAQAQVEGLTLATIDTQIKKYPVTTLHA